MKPVLKEWFVEAPWGKIALISWGCPKSESVLLVHGRQDSAATFVPLLQLLPDHFHYVAVDLPGHGHSDPFPTGLLLSRIHFVTPIEIVVRHLKWKSFVYLSHSMGGEIGLFYNAAHPNRIKKFIHLDIGIALHTVAQKSLTNFFKTYEAYYDNYEKFNVDDRIYTKARAVESVKNARGLSEALAELVLSRNLRPLHTAATPDQIEYKLSWDKRLKNLTNLNLSYEHMLGLFTTNVPPSLFIAATESIKKYQNCGADTLIQEMRKRVQKFEYKVVEGSHDVHLTNPELIADDVTAFLTANSVQSKL